MVATLTRPAMVTGKLALDNRLGALDGMIRCRADDFDLEAEKDSCRTCRRANYQVRAYSRRDGSGYTCYQVCPECGASSRL